MSDSLNLSSGALSGGISPARWSSKNRISRLARELAGSSSLDLRFRERFFYRRNSATDNEDALFPAFDLMSNWTRTSRAWDDNWDGVAGSAVGRLEEYAAGEIRYGDDGLKTENSAATNQVSNPLFEGADDTTAPTGMTYGVSGDFTWTKTGSGVENGWKYIELTGAGTPTTDVSILFSTVAAIAASAGQDWTFALGLRLVSGALPATPQMRIFEYDAGTAQIGSAGVNLSTLGTADDSHRRFWFSRALVASTASIVPTLYFSGTNGIACNMVIRLYAPQLELGTAPSTPVFPVAGTPGASTRAADTFASGFQVTRASKGWDPDWDFASGSQVGNLTEFNVNTPRIGPKGLLLESERVNLITNPRCAGDDGSFGYLPDGWELYNIGGFNNVAKSSQEERRGWPSVLFSYTGTPVATGFYETLFGDRTNVGDGVTDLTGNTYTGAVCVAIETGDLTNVQNVVLRIREFNSGGINLGFTQLDITNDLDKDLRRFILSHTCANGGVYVGFSIAVTGDGGGAVNLGLRLSAPQFENALTTSSPIFPVEGAVTTSTRSKDVPETDVALFGADEPWTVYMKTLCGPSVSLRYLMSYTDAAGQDYSAIYANASFVYGFTAENGLITEQVFPGSAPNPAPGDTLEVAFRQEANNAAISTNGHAQGVDTSWNIPIDPATRLSIGMNPFTGAQFEGYIQDLRFFPVGLSNSELEALVGNS